MGMNMVGKGVNTVVAAMLERFSGSELLALSGNYCTDKKPSAVNWIEVRLRCGEPIGHYVFLEECNIL